MPSDLSGGAVRRVKANCSLPATGAAIGRKAIDDHRRKAIDGHT
jgi:hypothetical protein